MNQSLSHPFIHFTFPACTHAAPEKESKARKTQIGETRNSQRMEIEIMYVTRQTDRQTDRVEITLNEKNITWGTVTQVQFPYQPSRFVYINNN